MKDGSFWRRTYGVVLFAMLFAPLISVFNFTADIELVRNGSDIGGTDAANLKGLLVVAPLLVFLLHTALLRRVDTSVVRQALRLCLPIFVLYGYGLVTALWSAFPQYSALRAALLICATASGVAVSAAYFARYQGNFLGVIVKNLHWATLLICGFMLVAEQTAPELARTYEGQRLGGFLIHPNTIGLVGGILVLLSVARYRLSLPLSSIGVVVGGVVLFESDSKSAVVGLVLLGFVALVRARGNRVLKYLAAVGAAVALAFVATLPQVVERATRGGDVSDVATLTNRTLLWNGLFGQLDLQQALIGSGFATLTGQGYFQLEHLEMLHAHNGYLQVFFGTGVLGVLCLLMFLRRTLRLLFRRNPEYGSESETFTLSLLVLYVLINNFTEASFGNQVMPQYVMFIVAVCAMKRAGGVARAALAGTTMPKHGFRERQGRHRLTLSDDAT